MSLWDFFRKKPDPRPSVPDVLEAVPDTLEATRDALEATRDVLEQEYARRIESDRRAVRLQVVAIVLAVVAAVGTALAGWMASSSSTATTVTAFKTSADQNQLRDQAGDCISEGRLDEEEIALVNEALAAIADASGQEKEDKLAETRQWLMGLCPSHVTMCRIDPDAPLRVAENEFGVFPVCDEMADLDPDRFEDWSVEQGFEAIFESGGGVLNAPLP